MIRVGRNEGCVTLTIDRPDKANSLTKAMLQQMDQAVAEADGAQVLVLTGAGMVFSAGADLDEARAGLATDPIWEQLSGRIAAFPGLSVAALNGTLAGGAFGMALACDLRITVPNARFFYPVMKLGFLPQPSDPVRMVGLIGPARAKMILMAGQKIDAAEALSWGLIDRICPPDELQDHVQNLIAAATAATPAHVAAIKAMIPV